MTQLMMADFSYDVLDAETRVVVQQKTTEIRDRMRTSVESIIGIGQRLIDVKARLPHGDFGLWLNTEFQWSQDTAHNYMRVAETYGDNPIASEFAAAAALYALAAPSTPQAARDEAQQLMEQGIKVTGSQAKAIAQKHKPTPPARPVAPTPTAPSQPVVAVGPPLSIGEIPALPGVPATIRVGDNDESVAAVLGLEQPAEIASTTASAAANSIAGMTLLDIPAVPAPPAATDTKDYAYAVAAVELARQVQRLAQDRLDMLQDQLFAQGLEAMPKMDLDAIRGAAKIFIDGAAFKSQAGFIAMGITVEVGNGE
jgi:hypothetical protein